MNGSSIQAAAQARHVDEAREPAGAPDDTDWVEWRDRMLWRDGAYVDPYEAWVAIMRARVRDDWDLLFGVEGPERRGKTTFGWLNCKAIDPTFTVDRIVFQGHDIPRLAEELEPYQAILLDESVLGMMSEDAATRYVRDLKKYFIVCGERNLIVGVCMVDWGLLSPYFRDHRMTWNFWIEKRGLAIASTKTKWRYAKRSYFHDIFEVPYSKIAGPEWEEYLRRKRAFGSLLGPGRQGGLELPEEPMSRAWAASALAAMPGLKRDVATWYVDQDGAVGEPWFREAVEKTSVVASRVKAYRPVPGRRNSRVFRAEQKASQSLEP